MQQMSATERMINMKKLMILGAGVYQVPLIKRAKEKGLYTIVVSIPGDYPGFKLADKIYYENTTDCEKIPYTKSLQPQYTEPSVFRLLLLLFYGLSATQNAPH